MNIYVIGMGPGDAAYLTPRALEAIQASDVIVGYGLYVELLGELVQGKECITTPMRQEIQRCEMARDKALGGRTVSVVCSGDAGIYGMAGLVHQVCEGHPELTIEVVPGITAACSGAAVLGAPLTHDFAVISLSDLLTPWEKIETRLDCAAQGDFCIALYNPSSKKRADYLKRACDILLRHQPETIACGIVRQIGREGQEYELCTLGELREKQVDMFTTVFIGNSQTRVIHNKLVTPRGYENK